MTIHGIKSIFLCMFLVLNISLLYPQGTEIKPVLLTENLYLVSGLGGNIVFLVTQEGVLVVDSGSMTVHGRQVTEAIAKITSQPVKYLVITHYHYDHAGGVKGFGPGVTIIGHSKLEKNLQDKSGPLIAKLALPQFKVYLEVLEAKVKKFEADQSPQLETARGQLEFVRSLYNELKNFTPFQPDISFETKKVIRLGGETIELIYMGSGHTDDSCLVYFPERKLLHTGDLFVNGVCPFIDELASADIGNWIALLKNIIDHHRGDTIVPGHGKPGNADDLKKTHALLVELRDAVSRCLKRGLSLEQTRREIELPSFKDLQALDLLKYGIEAVYNQLKDN